MPTAANAPGPIDILVNNAAAAIYQPTTEMSLKRRRLMFEVNVHTAIDLIQQVLPAMIERGRGWIVNLSSASSKHQPGPPFDATSGLAAVMSGYGASKAALARLTNGLALEVGERGIAVNTIAPVVAVRSPGADALIGDTLDANPDFVEPMETMVAAVLELCACDPTKVNGGVHYSQPLLESLAHG